MDEVREDATMKILLLNQCFHPDHVATAQHLTDLALELVKAGHRVTVVASSRGYDNPEVRYPVRETWRGIDIRRIWTPGLGKRAKWRRLVDFAIFWGNATRILLFLPKQDVTVCLTSPPLISTLGTVMALLKGGAVVPWVMDLNPDEAVAAGWLKAGGFVERMLTLIQNWSFRRASRIIALDRFMADRLKAKGVREEVIHIDAPWSHDQAVRYDVAAREAFRAEHGLTGKFVVMYSGNHSPCHPLDVVMAAADEFQSDDRVHFLFAGGGSEFNRVQAFANDRGLKNITCLPYQPMEKLSGSLSAADLHLVVMGDPFVGIVHPCKIYNILTLGIPFLFIGPGASHGSDLALRLNDPAHGRLARNGDVAGIVSLIHDAMALGPRPVNEAAQALGAEFSHSKLCPRLVQVIEQAAARA
ncbi:glycosyltransferase family 4 protein [Prosthecobacter sp.]|uniref:glycosyltransferase family 4 protein n=1 Tax=Prosthecobacter sp. TaxID=1965333 RepID=UPI001DA0DC20|nr:glycosyltransferase family 4 protein [Prosthecobacter sp.]MCB1275584.1 glycosyltransferase family 4 protein [Prosthecobacter sp.]